MRLTNIEIKGFKSFADKTTIHFNKDITGIVGPNGCGKSNVVDAIRWVLGEQKTSALRSSKMENLIFNGSNKRRSSSLAEVSLTFENTRNILPTEYSSVTISRLYFRNGDSEYRLNDVPCRLKDITNLFMDTGIGSDSYAIIELHMIDDILSDKDNSRRRLFEQAAGIEKYKKRKKETHSKLQSTEADLDRVDDLLFEIENNLKTLESQARRAKRYYKLKDQYRDLSIELSILMLTDQKEAFNTLEKQIESESDKRSEVEARIKKLESKLENEKAQNIEKEQSLSQRQKDLNKKINLVQEKENHKSLLHEKINHSNERKNSLLQQVEHTESQLKELHASIDQLETRESSEAKDKTALENKLEKLQTRLNDVTEKYTGNKEKLEKEKAELQALEKDIYAKEKTLAVHQAQYENLMQTIAEGKEDSASSMEKLNGLNSLREKLEKKQKTKKEAIAKIQHKEDSLRHEMEDNADLIEKIKEELTVENRQLDAKRNEYQLTKNLIDNLEGYPESIKFLRKEVSYTKNAPLLSDIISCSAEYRAAIENFLEPFLNYYVVQTAEEAVACINILSDASKGRANFFILDEFEKYDPNFEFGVDNAIPALEILDIESKYNKLAAFLLDRVYIIPENQMEMGTDVPDEVIYLTKGGKYIRSSYSLSGGAVGLFEGKKLGRIKNLEKLHKDIKSLEQKTLKVSRKLNELIKKQEKLRNAGKKDEIQQAKGELDEVSHELVTVRTRIENEEALLLSASGKQEETKEKLESIKKQDQQLEKSLEEQRARCDDKSKHVDQAEKDFQEVSRQLNEVKENYNEDQILFHQHLNKLNTTRQELQYNRQKLEGGLDLIKRNRSETDTLTTRIKEFENELQQTGNLLERIYQEKADLEKNADASEQDYFRSKGDINVLEDEMRALGKQKEQVDVILGSLKDKVNDLKLDLASMKERLSVEFDVDINELISQEPSGDYSLEELTEKVEKIKQRLDRFGEINPMSVEAFEEMKERFDFIGSQKEDLTEARRNLLETIREIDKTARKHFLDSFEKVRDHFKEVFRTLFTDDDTCDLVLNDPDNPLESKIEILAQPKGKKPLTINQLSGGEKTLTATALLFSLYLIKPAPFCVFDEVDAPLDDVNVDKFNNIIRQFSRDSQFIIVTHNKQTMTAVDVIYGVTMAEEGVSKVVPVDFSSLN